MKKITIAFVLTGIILSCNSPNQSKKSGEDNAQEKSVADSTASMTLVEYTAIDSEEALIATSLMAAPKESRAGCKVIGYNLAGDFVTFKEGTNEFIVLVDDLKKPGFNAACYHKDLEPFMSRGRELRAMGKSSTEIFNIREQEAKSGDLDMGKSGSTLHLYYGPDQLYDRATNKVKGANYRYVVYLPFATAESTGLPEKPLRANHPWIMNPGTHRAHIMITPLPEEMD